MQKNINHIYEEIIKEGGDPELVKSIGTFVFKDFISFMQEPNTLIYAMKGIGHFYLRSKKLINYIATKQEYYENPEHPTYKLMMEENEESFKKKIKRFHNLKERVLEYDKFRERKQEYRELKNKLRKPIIKTDDNVD